MRPGRTRPALALWLGLLAAGPLSAGTAAPWLDAPPDRGGLDSLLAPPGRPLGGRDPERDPALSPDGRWLAYAAQVAGNWDIWLRDLQASPGDPARRLTEHVAADLRPSFSADGSSLLFISHREDAAGDIWELPLARWSGRPQVRKARALLRRPGAQDHACRDGSGALVWDEEGPGGCSVMRKGAGGEVRELARPASLPRPGHGGLYLASLPDSQAARIEWLPDSLLDSAGPQTPRRSVWLTEGPLLDFLPGAEGRLWAATLEESAALRPGGELAAPSQLWLLDPAARRPPRPLLEEGRAPRQLALAEQRLVYTEDARPSLLWVENPEGRFAPGGVTPDAAALLELSRRFSGNELGLPLLQTIQAASPGTPAADDAALDEFRLRMQRGEELALLRERAEVLSGWLGADEARLRLRALLLEAELRAAPRRNPAELEALFGEARGAGWPGAAAEIQLARARLELRRERLDQALGALLKLAELPDSLPEQAEGLALRVLAYEGLGQGEAARGALRTLALEHPERPDLLADWLRRDLASLEGLSPARARLRLRERLVALGSIPPLSLALLVELAGREAEEGADGRAVALEDLRAALETPPDRLGPFERRAWTQGRRLEAQLLREAGRLDEALGRLGQGDAALVAASEPALAGILRARRIDWLLERARSSAALGDWEPVEADCRLAQELDPVETRAWRLRLEALARLQRLEELERELRGSLKRKGGQAEAALRGEALRRRAVECWALGLLLSWRAETDPSQLPESDGWLEEALNLDDRLAPACLTLSWNLGRELQLAEGRAGGLKGFFSELGRGRETWSRLRHRGLSRLEDPDEESLRDRAILLAERGLRWTDAARDPQLAAALCTNLGNLHFSLGEFGALKARQAWEARLALPADFGAPVERLQFLKNLGTARQWSRDLERAAADLDSALQLATRLDRQSDRLELLSRLAMLAGERERPVEAQGWLRQSLALETDPGQRALLWRNLAMVQLELGEAEEAGLALGQAEKEAGQGDWPLAPEQNWLRLHILGIGVPLWNFPGLYTGQGRLDWGPPEEMALRQSLRDEMSGRRGALDQRMEGLHARRRLLRKQGDLDGMLRVDLALARELASLGDWEAAAIRYSEAARAAREAVLAGPEARALEGALLSLQLGRGQERDPARLARLRELSRKVAADVDRLLDPAGATPPSPDQRVRLELLRVRELDVLAQEADPVHALLLRCRGLLLLEDLEAWRKESDVVWTPRQRLGVDLAWARLATAGGDPPAARERLEPWQLGELPAEAALLVAWARLQADRVEGRSLEPRELALLRGLLEDLPVEPDNLSTYRRLAGLVEELAALWAEQGTQAAAQAADWRAWWMGRRLWEQADPLFPLESWTNAWGNLRADLRRLDELLQARLDGRDGQDPGALEAARAAVEHSRTVLREGDARLGLWLEPDARAAGRLPDFLAEGMRPVLATEGAGRWWLGSPSVHALLRAEPVLSPDECALITGQPMPTGDPRLKLVPPGALEEPDHADLDARVLCLDAVLHPVPGAPQASWLELEGRRVPLRALLGWNLPGETLLLGEVDWSHVDPEQWAEGWLVLERLLAQAGLRRLLLPGPGLRARGAELGALGLTQLGDSLPDPPSGWWCVGAPPRRAAERREDQRLGLEDLVLLGNQYRDLRQPDAAWRAYRQALRLAVQDSQLVAAGRLVRLGLASALDGSRPGEALDLLLTELGRMDATQVEWERVSGRLVQLADLAGRPEQADSLWRQLVVERRVPGLQPRTLEPGTAAELRATLERRLASLVRRGGQEQAARLAWAADLLPSGEDPRKALFLARLYLDSESAPRARQCLQTPGPAWESLDSLEALDALELRSLVAQRLGDLAEARHWMEEAVVQVGRQPLPAARRCLHLQRRADLTWSLGEYGACLALLDEAETLRPAEDLSLALLLANTRGLLATDLDEPEEAAAAFARAQEAGLRLQDPLELSAVYNNQSRLAQRRGEWLEALEACRRATEQDSLSRSTRRALGTLRNRAASLRGLLGPDLHLPEAWSSLPEGLLRQRRASAELGRLARELESGRRVARQLGDGRESCRLELELAWLRLELGDAEAALTVAGACADSARQRGYQREELEARLVHGRALLDLKRDEEALLLLEAALLRAEEETARLAPVRFDPGRGWLQRRLADELVGLHARHERPWEALAASERGRVLGLQEMLARRGGVVLPATPRDRKSLEALLRRSLAADQALLAWHLGEREAWRFQWEKGELGLARLEVPRDSLRRLVALHRERTLGFLSVEPTGALLAECLLPASWLENPPARLWLLPQAELLGLAFESLRLPDGRWLGEATALCRSGSLAEMDFAAGLPGGSLPAAIWSDPQVEGQAQLEYTALEAGELARLFPDCRLLEGKAASESALRQDVGARRFRHFACHAWHDSRSPAECALLLSPGEGLDGRLAAPEIAGLDLPTGLSMLSACETALGRPGEEASAGLPRAFLAAGSRGVVASLWKVDDLSTAVLVKHLYRGLARGLPADRALQEAQAEVRRWVHAHPAHWAAFCLSGQPLPEPQVAKGR